MKYDAEVARAIAYWEPVLGVRIDPKLVHAVIQKESSHGAALETAESRGRRSYGPMMVLDTTALSLGVPDPASLRDPARGIWWGVRYLGDQLKRFRTDLPAAVSAYNAGPGNAKRSAATGRFPNQSYVDSVLGWWKLYGGGAASAAAVIVGLAVGAFLLLRARGRRGRG